MTMNIDNVTETSMEKMDDALEALKKDFVAIRTGKASPALVEGLMIDYYGTSTRLRDISSITAPEPRLLVIQPWDRSAIKNVEKAIQASDIGISPVSDGRVIRLPIPELSEERRKDMAKRVHARAEESRVEVRNARRDTIDFARKAEKASDITEDDLRDTSAEIQELTDQYITDIDKLMAAKEEELMQV